MAIVGEHNTGGGDAGRTLAMMLLALVHIAPPISQELGLLARAAYGKLKEPVVSQTDVLADDQEIIAKQTLVAVDKLYASKATEIHSPPDAWDFKLGVLIGQKRTIALEIKVQPESPQEVIDNIIDIIRPYVGTFGATVVHLLYETANDIPYWRNQLIPVATNDLLDR